MNGSTKLFKEIEFDRRSQLNIFVTQPIDEKKIREVLKDIKEIDLKTILTFIVEEQKDFDFFISLIFKYDIKNYNFKPYFNGNNIKFFEDNIFISCDDIFEKNNP